MSGQKNLAREAGICAMAEMSAINGRNFYAGFAIYKASVCGRIAALCTVF